MLLVTYDIQNDKIRARFAKFLKRFGRRLQYSVYEIKNSSRILTNIETEIVTNFENKFTQGDSVLIFRIGDNDCIKRFGYPVNEESDLIMS